MLLAKAIYFPTTSRTSRSCPSTPPLLQREGSCTPTEAPQAGSSLLCASRACTVLRTGSSSAPSSYTVWTAAVSSATADLCLIAPYTPSFFHATKSGAPACKESTPPSSVPLNRWGRTAGCPLPSSACAARSLWMRRMEMGPGTSVQPPVAYARSSVTPRAPSLRHRTCLTTLRSANSTGLWVSALRCRRGVQCVGCGKRGAHLMHTCT
mmetsp:Transcript_28745/g.72290  ORF Transcript_28745/g.72290 Transcript_28745/m.72290 type:complete len:209 (-) Transcript_28745:2671-3297(-)